MKTYRHGLGLLLFCSILCCVAACDTWQESTRQPKVHALFILLKNDKRIIRDTVDQNKELMTDLMIELSHNCEVNLTLMESFPAFTGQVSQSTYVNANQETEKKLPHLGIIKPAQVTKWLSQVKTGPTDTLLIYFSGHGKMNNLFAHYLHFDKTGTKLNREVLERRLQEKPARLKMLITDTCSEMWSSELIDRETVAKFGIEPEGKPRFYAKNLFLEHTGFLNVTAALPGKLAYGDTDIGGYFTHAIAGSLNSDTDKMPKDNFLSWIEVFDAAKKRTQELAEQGTPPKSQTPFKHSLPKRLRDTTEPPPEGTPPSSEEPARITGNDGAEMALIPAGEFQMGSNNGADDEIPVHPVYVDAFYMDVYEVTNMQFKAFVDANPQWQKDQIPSKYHSGLYLKRWSGNDYPNGKGNHPVTYVSWHAAMAYAEWAGKRLPTEAEWEKAARGGLQGQTYPWGNTIDASQANYNKNLGGTTSVGSYGANGYGLYDMAGNMWEWCVDVYQADFYEVSPPRNPVAGGLTNQTNTSRVLRGGSWYDVAQVLRVADRYGSTPPYACGNLFGFRCARAVTP